MIDLTAPLEGMRGAEERLSVAAGRIARAPFAAPGDQVDLSAEMVALLESRNAFRANVKVAQTADEMAQSVLDILG